MSRSVTLPAPGPWGFRISGGRDFNKCISVSKVVAGSKADLVELKPGDVIITINGAETSEMINMEAQRQIKQCRGDLVLGIERPESNALNGSPTDTFVAQRFQAVLHVGEDESQSTREQSWRSSPSRSPAVSPTAELQAASQGVSWRSVSPVSSQWRPIERTPSPVDLALKVKDVSSGPGQRRSLSPAHISQPDPRLTRSAESSPRELRGPVARSLSPSPVSVSQGTTEHRPVNRIDKDSEVYKMLQENRTAKEPPRQSARFRQLQEALDTDQEAAAAQFPGRLSPSAPRFGMARYHVCEKCSSSIVTEAVKIRDGCYRHHECYACADCGLNLGMRGHFWVNDTMYCEKHARERYQATEGSS
ncbi:PDZ and LIM domain protein 2 [Mobula birostris]|uniref:PDZ and LIM domain protein 2 n=1 Tax=Mobula birostris TaxID=1983395 RepID=UPI003B287A6B